MDVTLENKHIQVKIRRKGAELYSVFSKDTAIEYMWSADPAFWGKTSPVLFPIVGALKDDTYLYDGESYSLTRHGFARDAMFDLSDQQADGATFSLSSNDSTMEKYPFAFDLQLEYKLVENLLEVTYYVKNNGDFKMFFSIGGHPAFKVPLTANSTFEDHHLHFDQIENAGRWPITPEGLIKAEPVALIENTSTLQLTRALFKDDALVFKGLKSDIISIRSRKHSHGLDFYFEGFPYLGIWTTKNADFLCIEPWCGIADAAAHDQHLQTKEGIVSLLPHELWSRTWKVRFY
jgi:galactose mutarotase-like enzyme